MRRLTVLLLGSGLLLWLLHPLTHLAEDRVFHTETSHHTGLPDAGDTDCPECALSFGASSEETPAELFFLPRSQNLQNSFGPAPVRQAPEFGFSLRAPPVLYV